MDHSKEELYRLAMRASAVLDKVRITGSDMAMIAVTDDNGDNVVTVMSFTGASANRVLDLVTELLSRECIAHVVEER